ncbi:MAG: citrate transporter [Pseudomonadota bacterium]
MRFLALLAAMLLAGPDASAATAAGTAALAPLQAHIALAGIPLEFLLFGAVLGLLAFTRLNNVAVAVGGAALITVYKLLWSAFPEGVGGAGLLAQGAHEWVGMANLLALLLGLTLLARHFESSKLPLLLPHFLPDSWLGPLALLLATFVLSSFLDNIAAAMIGGAIAHSVFRGRVHTGYLVGIVAAANAGGAGSVVGDTTTTMLWLAGVAPRQVLNAYVAAVVALAVCALPASLQQHAYQPIMKDTPPGVRVDWARVAIVAIILLTAIAANVVLSMGAKAAGAAFPFLGLALWSAILATSAWRRPDWEALPEALGGAIFLLALAWSAALMPVDALPPASWPSTLGLGFVSAVFNNIPLTALALKQGGFDWGFLAYTVGFGGSLVWFGSSAGVALAGMYPQARSVRHWVRQGWHAWLAYVLGFFAMLAVLGWHAG